MDPIRINLVKHGTCGIEKAIEIGGGMMGCDSSIRHSKMHKTTVKTTMKDLGPCVGFHIITPTYKIEGHSDPAMDIPEFIEKHVKKFLTKLRELNKNDEEMIAFIDGGVETNVKDSSSEISSAIVENLYETLVKEKVPVTMIAGQKDNSLSPRICDYATGKSIYISGAPFSGLNHNATQEEIENTLQNHFDFVEISSLTPLRVVESVSK